MVVGTIAVRAEIPTAGHITDAQIQEALWTYYYDIEKSVSYLTNKYINPKTPKKEAVKPRKKTEGKPFSFVQDAGSARCGNVLDDPGRLIVLS